MIISIKQKLKSLLKELGLEEYFSKKYIDYALIACSVALGFYLNQDVIYVAIFAFLIWQILAPLSSRVLIVLSLISLVMVPVTLVLRAEIISEKFAIVTFGLLIFSTIMIVAENVQKKRGSGK